MLSLPRTLRGEASGCSHQRICTVRWFTCHGVSTYGTNSIMVTSTRNAVSFRCDRPYLVFRQPFEAKGATLVYNRAYCLTCSSGPRIGFEDAMPRSTTAAIALQISVETSPSRRCSFSLSPVPSSFSTFPFHFLPSVFHFPPSFCFRWQQCCLFSRSWLSRCAGPARHVPE